MKKRGMILVLCLLISIPMIFGGCANMTPAQEGAAVGEQRGPLPEPYSVAIQKRC